MPELSVIIPYVNEWPLVMFTIRGISEELRDRVDFEIIAVNNYCDEVKAQGREEDRAGAQLDAVQRHYPWLKTLHYTEKLSHWQAKNMGVAESSGKFLWFCDAHCAITRDTLYNAFDYYRSNYAGLNGTLHLPLTYHIIESRRLIYKLVTNLEKGDVHYSFTPYIEKDGPYPMPCMSTCGMMMTRELFDELGGWPKTLGIYGGGENFINFTLAVLGKSVNIYSPSLPLHHHGDKRGYHWNADDWVRNRAAATYIFGGRHLAKRLIDNRKGNKLVLNRIYDQVLEECAEQRAMIKKKQVISIEDWIMAWDGVRKGEKPNYTLQAIAN